MAVEEFQYTLWKGVRQQALPRKVFSLLPMVNSFLKPESATLTLRSTSIEKCSGFGALWTVSSGGSTAQLTLSGGIFHKPLSHFFSHVPACNGTSLLQ